jgi:hypothetical protein
MRDNTHSRNRARLRWLAEKEKTVARKTLGMVMIAFPLPVSLLVSLASRWIHIGLCQVYSILSRPNLSGYWHVAFVYRVINQWFAGCRNISHAKDALVGFFWQVDRGWRLERGEIGRCGHGIGYHPINTQCGPEVSSGLTWTVEKSLGPGFLGRQGSHRGPGGSLGHMLDHRPERIGSVTMQLGGSPGDHLPSRGAGRLFQLHQRSRWEVDGEGMRGLPAGRTAFPSDDADDRGWNAVGGCMLRDHWAGDWCDGTWRARKSFGSHGKKKKKNQSNRCGEGIRTRDLAFRRRM